MGVRAYFATVSIYLTLVSCLSGGEGDSSESQGGVTVDRDSRTTPPSVGSFDARNPRGVSQLGDGASTGTQPVGSGDDFNDTPSSDIAGTPGSTPLPPASTLPEPTGTGGAAAPPMTITPTPVNPSMPRGDTEPASPPPSNSTTETDDYCGSLAEVLVSCGILSEGELGCEEPVGRTEVCTANCSLDATCEDFEATLCADTVDLSSNSVYFQCTQACQSLDFECANGSTTIPDGWVCDGADDCGDGSDEVDCAGSVFTCGDGDVIPADWICDSDDDCEDASDEADCEGEAFVCDDGETLPGNWRCDLEQDCADGSDEAGCAELLCQ